MDNGLVNSICFLLVFVGLQCATALCVQWIWKMATGSPDITATRLIVTTGVASAATLVVFAGARWCVLSKDYLRSRPWTVLVWCAVAAIGAVIPSMWLQEQMPDLPNMLESEFNLIMKDRWGYAVIGLLAPLAEEMVFRGAILRSLLQWNKRHWVGITLSALLFALVHGNPAQMPHALLAGLLLGWMFYRTGSIVPGVVFHWVNNTIAYASYNVMSNPDATLSELFGGDSSRVLLSVLFSLCILLPALFQLNLNMRKAK